jgi:hypothetical protein
MISAAHIVVYTKNAEADRAFFRDVLGFKSVDAGHGWSLPCRQEKRHSIRPMRMAPTNSISFATI